MTEKNDALRTFDKLNLLLKSLDLSNETKERIKELMNKLEALILLI